MLTGFSEETAKRYLDEIHDREHKHIDYFNKDYVEEYCYIKDGHLTSSTSPDFTIKPKFRLVRDFSEYLDHKDSKEILGVITAEGMHALGKYNRQDLFNAVSIDGLSPSNRKDLEDSFVNNNYIVKKLSWTTIFEGVLALYFAGAVVWATYQGEYTFIIYHMMLALGFGFIFFFTVRHLNLK